MINPRYQDLKELQRQLPQTIDYNQQQHKFKFTNININQPFLSYFNINNKNINININNLSAQLTSTTILSSSKINFLYTR